MLAISGGGVFIGVQEVFPSDELRYAEITEEELNKYPLLRKAIDEYEINKTQLWNVDYEEWNRTQDFIGKKQRESRLLFSIMDAELEKELPLTPLNRSISPMKLKNIPVRLKNIFQSSGYNLSEYAFIEFGYDRWMVFEKQYLFGVVDAELENELNRVPFRMGGQLRKEDINRIVRLREVFESEGLSLSENHWLHRSPENWIIIEESGNIYEIWKEDGMLNFYTQDKLTYELWKEDDKLNVYDGKYREPIFKIGGKYYNIGFGHAD